MEYKLAPKGKMAVLCFDNGYMGKQPLAWKEFPHSPEF